MEDQISGGRVSKRNFLKKAGSGALAIGLAGCSEAERDRGTPTDGDGGSTGTPSGGNGDSEDEVIRFGIVAPESGPYASSGERIVAANRLIIDEINNAGGINGKEIEVFVKDTQTNPERGVQVARELIEDDDVHLITGGTASSVGLAMQSLAGERGVPFIFEAVSSDFVGESCNKYTYTNAFSVEMQTNGTIPYLINEQGAESFYFISADYSWGQSSWDYYQQRVAELGGTIEGNAFAPFGTEDYSNQITKAINSGADTVFTTLFGQDLINCFTQMEEFGAREVFKNRASAALSITGAQAMEEAVPGAFFAGIYHWTAEGAANQEFVSKYEDKTGEKPTVTAALEYGSTTELMKILEKVGPDRDKIAATLEGWEADPFFKGGRGFFRACDHMLVSDWFVTRGKDPANVNGPFDHLEIVKRASAGDIGAPCSDECSLPGWS